MEISAVTLHKRSRKVFSTKLEHLPEKINSEYFVPTFSKELCIETRTTAHVENPTFGSNMLIKLLNEALDDTAISTLLKVSGGYLLICLDHDDFGWHWLKGGHCLQYLPVVPITTVGLKYMGHHFQAPRTDHTHLLRINAGESWWRELPGRLSEQFRLEI